MATQKSHRRSRKRHKPGTARRAAPPAKRPEQTIGRQAPRQSPAARANPLRALGEPPPSPFGPIPVSEIAILAGAIGVLIGLFGHNPIAAIVGAIVCALAVLEFTSREHFSGYRSHTSLLAAFPPAAVEAGLAILLKPSHPALLLLAVVPVYALGFWLLRRRFMAARQLRLARPPMP